MIHTYQHTFKDGSEMTLQIDLSKPTPTFSSSGYKGGNDAEYEMWRNNVVFPDLRNRLTPQQLMKMAAFGKDLVRKYKTT